MRKLILHEFTLGDVDDPEIYAAGPLHEWEKTDQGKWVMANCSDPCYRIQADPKTLGYRVQVYGELEDKLATEFLLRWNKEQY